MKRIALATLTLICASAIFVTQIELLTGSALAQISADSTLLNTVKTG
jgi:hypothetical protein